MEIKDVIDNLGCDREISLSDLTLLLGDLSSEEREYLFGSARTVREQFYGKDVYIRGLIEFTNYCRNDCYYCGIRKSCRQTVRYRLSTEQILACAEEGYRLGFRTFVLQGGEDPYYTAERIAMLVRSLRERFPDCAITLSVGERDREEYKLWFECGADRYLLRHETADESHYGRLHPPAMSWKHRMRCLRVLQEIGYQTGAGFMVGSPFQTIDCIYQDIRFLQELKPQMIGIGPFIPAADTPFSHESFGSFERTLRLLAILRLLFPAVLLPATTALGTIAPNGREQGLLAGANVVMPNLSPTDVRWKYNIYDNKLSTGEESAQSVAQLRSSIEKIGYQMAICRGDYVGMERSRNGYEQM